MLRRNVKSDQMRALWLGKQGDGWLEIVGSVSKQCYTDKHFIEHLICKTNQNLTLFSRFPQCMNRDMPNKVITFSTRGSEAGPACILLLKRGSCANVSLPGLAEVCISNCFQALGFYFHVILKYIFIYFVYKFELIQL